MVFHENAIFPDKIAYGAKSNPSFRSLVIEGDSGVDEPIARWPTPRRILNAKYGIASLEDMNVVYDFWLARNGPVAGFRIQDFYDYSTATNHRNTPSFSDQVLGTYDGSTLQFQLKKFYVSGGISVPRIITKPIAGTTVIGVNGSNSTNFVVDTATGVVTLTVAPTVGHVITGGCKFHLAAGFAGDMDEDFGISVESFNAGEVPDIIIKERIGDTTTPEPYNYGGGSIIPLVSGQIFPLNFGHDRFLIASGSSGISASFLMPNPATLELGGIYWKIANSIGGSPTISIKNHTNTSTITTLSALNSSVMMVVYPLGTSKFWGAIK